MEDSLVATKDRLGTIADVQLSLDSNTVRYTSARQLRMFLDQ